MKTNLNSASVSNYDPNSCHLERSERTLGDLLQKILRCAQNDKNQIHNYFWSLVILIFYCFINPAYATIERKNIVGLWLFDEGEGKRVKDSSLNGNHADFLGDPKWVKGKLDFGLEFDGADDYIAAPDSDSLDITDKITIVAWIKGDAWPAANHVVRKIADAAQDSVYILRIQPDTMKIYLNTKNAPDKRFGYQ